MSASIKYGAYNEENLKSSEHFYDKLEDKIMLFYTPVRSGTYCVLNSKYFNIKKTSVS